MSVMSGAGETKSIGSSSTDWYDGREPLLPLRAWPTRCLPDFMALSLLHHVEVEIWSDHAVDDGGAFE